MSPNTRPTLLNHRLTTPAETAQERARRVSASLKVAREMLRNGCSVNTVTRYTGLTEEQLRASFAQPALL